MHRLLALGLLDTHLIHTTTTTTSLPINWDYLNQAVLLPAKAYHSPDSNTCFVGIEGMKQALRAQGEAGFGDIQKFQQWAEWGRWELFVPEYHRYDWWMFPICSHSMKYGTKYTVTWEEIQELKRDRIYLAEYRRGATLLMQSLGWDPYSNQLREKASQGQKWNDYPIRLMKLANSLVLFEQWDLYTGLREYVMQRLVPEYNGCAQYRKLFNYFKPLPNPVETQPVVGITHVVLYTIIPSHLISYHIAS